MGKWERLQGLSESCTLIPTGLAEWFPIWGSLGKPSKDFWQRGLVGGGRLHAIYSLLKSLMVTAP